MAAPRGRSRRRGVVYVLAILAGVPALGVSGYVVSRLWQARSLWHEFAFAPLEVLEADSVVVLKARRELLLTRDGAVVKRYPVALGFAPRGHKLREGDGRTPEGLYTLDWRRRSEALGPAIHVSYPSPEDRERAAAVGVDPGGGIMLHALSDALPWTTGPAERRTWTRGCIGLSPRHLREVWYAVADGTPIEIRP